MAPKSPLLRLDDMRDAISVIKDLADGVSYDGYQSDRLLRWAVERGIEIISEASRHIPSDLKAEYPSIPWQKVAGIGNVLRHEYMEIAPDIIWAVVRDELPALEAVVAAMIAATERAEE